MHTCTHGERECTRMLFYIAESLGQPVGSCITHVLGWPFTSKQQVKALNENCGQENPSAASDYYQAKR